MNCDYMCHDCAKDGNCDLQGLTSHEARDELLSENICPRCDGRGYIEMYAHVRGGECFLCAGTGEFEKKESEMTEFKNEDVSLLIQSMGMYKGRPCLKGLLSIKGQVFRWVAQAKYNKIYAYGKVSDDLQYRVMDALKRMSKLGVLKKSIGFKMNLDSLHARLDVMESMQ